MWRGNNDQTNLPKRDPNERLYFNIYQIDKTDLRRPTILQKLNLSYIDKIEIIDYLEVQGNWEKYSGCITEPLRKRGINRRNPIQGFFGPEIRSVRKNH